MLALFSSLSIIDDVVEQNLNPQEQPAGRREAGELSDQLPPTIEGKSLTRNPLTILGEGTAEEFWSSIACERLLLKGYWIDRSLPLVVAEPKTGLRKGDLVFPLYYGNSENPNITEGDRIALFNPAYRYTTSPDLSYDSSWYVIGTEVIPLLQLLTGGSGLRAEMRGSRISFFNQSEQPVEPIEAGCRLIDFQRLLEAADVQPGKIIENSRSPYFAGIRVNNLKHVQEIVSQLAKLPLDNELRQAKNRARLFYHIGPGADLISSLGNAFAVELPERRRMLSEVRLIGSLLLFALRSSAARLWPINKMLLGIESFLEKRAFLRKGEDTVRELCEEIGRCDPGNPVWEKSVASTPYSRLSGYDLSLERAKSQLVLRITAANSIARAEPSLEEAVASRLGLKRVLVWDLARLQLQPREDGWAALDLKGFIELLPAPEAFRRAVQRQDQLFGISALVDESIEINLRFGSEKKRACTKQVLSNDVVYWRIPDGEGAPVIEVTVRPKPLENEAWRHPSACTEEEIARIVGLTDHILNRLKDPGGATKYAGEGTSV